jgi:hypothetical protein
LGPLPLFFLAIEGTLPIKTITSILKVSTNIITSIAAHSNGLAAIQAIMSVTTFKAAQLGYKLFA